MGAGDLRGAAPHTIERLREEGTLDELRLIRPSTLLEEMGIDLPAPLDSGRSADLDFAESSWASDIPRLGRFIPLCELGKGGMGRVIEARDPELKRNVAIKVVIDPYTVGPAQLARFVAEAQVTAQLEHPGIVPVHEMGVTAEGKLYFVMKKVEGVSLRQVIDDLKAGVQAEQHNWGRQRLLTAFIQSCQAVAYAHDRKVLHRDIKPENIMLGRFGEVQVMDWGVAGVIGGPKLRFSTSELPAILDPEDGSAPISRVVLSRTQDGTTIGTPGYISPEQAQGLLDDLDGRTDVWSLGAVLYELLSLERAYEGPNIFILMSAAVSGPPPDPRIRAPHLRIPEELAAICLKAMATDPRDRYANASALAEAIEAYLEGSARRAAAEELLEEASHLLVAATEAREESATLRHEAEERLKTLPPFAREEEKIPVWDLQDEADGLEELAELDEVRFLQACRGALERAPDLGEAHAMLADYHQAQHAVAEARRDHRAAALHELQMRQHDRGTHAGYLRGMGLLSLETNPEDAQVDIYRFAEKNRRLVPEFDMGLGKTPMSEVELPAGSYLLKIRARGRIEVRYPVHIGRQAHWFSVPPRAQQTLAVYLPKRDELHANEAYVPAGWFWSGGDAHAFDSLPRRWLWCHPFVISKVPVSNAQYIAFLDDLVRTDRADASLRYTPRDRSGREFSEDGTLIYGRRKNGCFSLKKDEDGEPWLPEQPVSRVDWECAAAYARWYAAQSGESWRLPSELEWEKAARGVDGRYYPWGDWLDPSWCCMRDSHAGRPRSVPGSQYSTDESPYGVLGMAGNVRSWCADRISEPGLAKMQRVLLPDQLGEEDEEEPRIIKGGSYLSRGRECRSAFRTESDPFLRDATVGIRLVRDLPGAVPR